MSVSWQPTAPEAHLKLRAKMLSQIRDFFAKRQVLEVETPLLSQHTVTDLFIDSFQIPSQDNGLRRPYFLQTSPEYAMKRLIAAGSGSIYQICKAFRNNESGRQHNPEFTMLEWYRMGFNHHDLMNEMDALLQLILGCAAAERISYQSLFLTHFGIDPLNCNVEALLDCARQNELDIPASVNDKDTLLQILLSQRIEPELGFDQPVFLYDFPPTQAALAKISGDPPVAERFEVYIQGVELANGFHELTDSQEQYARFEKDQAQRKKLNRFVPDIDVRFIDALEHGLPDCAGVALGLDRLLMVLANTQEIDQVINFPWKRA